MANDPNGSANQGLYGDPGAGPSMRNRNPDTGQLYYNPQDPYGTIQQSGWASSDPSFALGGSPGAAYDLARQQYSQSQGALNCNAPGIDYGRANADYGQYQGTLGAEGGLANQLQGIANGGTTGADYAFQQGLDRSIAAGQAGAASAAGGAGYALAQRSAMGNAAAMQSQGTAQLGQQKFAEEAQARSQLGALYGQMGGQELGAYGQGIQMGQFGANEQINQEQLNQQLGEFYGAQGQQTLEDQQRAYEAQQLGQQQFNELQYGSGVQGDRAIQSGGFSAFGSLLGSMGSGGNSSDIRAKTDVQPMGGVHPYMAPPQSPADAYAAPGQAQAPAIMRTSPRPFAMAAQPSSAMRPIVMSDARAKEEAFSRGARAGAALAVDHDTGAAAMMERASPDHDTGRAAIAERGAPHISYTTGMPMQQAVRPPALASAPPPGPAHPGAHWSPTTGGPMYQSLVTRPSSPQMLAVSSDERGKRSPADDYDGVPHHPADDYLDTLSHSASTYRYKDPHDEPATMPTGGKYMGVMAQDLERVPEIGGQLVKDGPRGKYLESGANLSAALAGLGRLHERVSGLERRGR